MHQIIERFATGKPANWNQKILLVVIHLSPTDTYETAFREVALAQANKADGVFIIDMDSRLKDKALVALVDATAKSFPGFFVGINDLAAADPSITMGLIKGTDIAAIWSDKTGNRGLIETARDHTGCTVPLFSGVLFKYQWDFDAPDGQIPAIVQAALPYVDVLTTSGRGTGIAADNHRLALLREAAGPEAIVCLSSGVDNENVAGSLPYVDIINASTSLVDQRDRLIPSKVLELHHTIEDWRPATS